MQQQNSGHKNRYPGGRSFHEDDRDLFFGRDTDIERLLSMLMLKQVIILLGKSGSGKSSLINAGIIPALQKSSQYEHFIIRFNNFSKIDSPQWLAPTDKVIETLSATLKRPNKELAAAIKNHESFWYCMKQNQSNYKKGQPKKFILFFEQFEELFTYSSEEVQRFSKQLAQLIYSPIPSSFRKEIGLLEKNGLISESLADLIYQKTEIQIIFSIRADRLSQMNVLTSLHPLIMQNCYELEPLSALEAVTAITEPAKMSGTDFKTPPFAYKEDAIEKILRNIIDSEDQKIETASLQIVCRYVEDKLVAQNQNVAISADDLGNITNIYQNYYREVLDRFSGNEKDNVQKLIEEQLINDGRRNALPGSYIQEQLGVSNASLNILEETSLLRKEHYTRNQFMYEISHDTIAAAVIKIAAEHKADRKQKKLERELFDQKILTLKKRRSVRNLSFLLIIAAILFVTTLWFAISYNQALNKIRDDNRRSAAYKVKMAQLAKKEALSYAQDHLLTGDSYLQNRTPTTELYALDAYRKALDTLRIYPHDTLYTKIAAKIQKLMSTKP